jgi:hypothetical protein
MSTELDIPADEYSRLDALGLPFMLTGSLALAYYANPRMTHDLDVDIAYLRRWAPALGVEPLLAELSS